MPDQKAQRLRNDYELSAYDAGVLTASAELADYYETVVRELRADPGPCGQSRSSRPTR